MAESGTIDFRLHLAAIGDNGADGVVRVEVAPQQAGAETVFYRPRWRDGLAVCCGCAGGDGTRGFVGSRRFATIGGVIALLIGPATYAIVRIVTRTADRP